MRKDLIYSAVGVTKMDVDANLVSTGTYWATKLTTKLDHLKDLTANWIEIAIK